MQNQDFTEVALFQIMAPDAKALSESMELINNDGKFADTYMRHSALMS